MASQSEFKGTSRFIIQRQLGSGGFGNVYEVFDQERKTVVALKTLHQTDAESLYRFKQEFRVLADIHHPNLVSLYELMSDGEQWFFTMELVQGVNFLEYVWGRSREDLDYIGNAKTVRASDLEQIITQKVAEPTLKIAREAAITNKRIEKDTYDIVAQKILGDSSDSHFLEFSLDETRLRGALRQLAEGISVLHDAGKLHRDLKPSNVLVTHLGRVVILDLGLAVEVAAKGTHESMHIVGTPAYMSPEQGTNLAVSKASDWYSIGVILYEALTGRVPFTGSMVDILVKRQSSEPPPPSELVKGVPADLNRLCQDLLYRDPKLRPTGKAVLQKLGKNEQDITFPTVPTSKISSLSGRGNLLKDLKDAFYNVRAGTATTVYLEGYAGIGKTALVNYFLEGLQQAEQNLVVLTGRCYGQEDVPYKALDSVIDALSQYLKRLPPMEVEALLPRDMSALARLFPVLKQILTIASSRQRVLEIPNAQELRRRASAALRELLARLSDKRDLVIFIDDLQWGDTDSGVLLSELLRPPEPPAMLLIASYRSEDQDTSPILNQLFDSQSVIRQSTDTRKIIVSELSLEESRQLALNLLGKGHKNAKTLSEIIAKESQGIPLLIDELVRYSLTDDRVVKDLEQMTNVDSSRYDINYSLINDVIQRRVIKLPPDARRLLELIAAAGQPIERSIIKKSAQLENEEQSAFSALRVGRLIRVVTSGGKEKVVCYHDGIQKTIISRLDTKKLVEYHRRLAVALEETSPKDAKSLATHFRIAGDIPKALDYTIIAAEQAVKALAFDNAARLYKIALELNPGDKQHEIEIKLGETLANAGRGEESACAYLAATKGLDSTQAIELQRRAAEQFLINGYMDEGLAVLREVLGKVKITLPETTRAAFLSFLFQRLQLWIRGLNFTERQVGEIPSSELLRIDVCWSATVGLAYVNSKRAIDFQARHLLLALNAGEPYRVARALALEAAYSAKDGGRKRDRTATICHQAMVLAKQINHPHTNALAILELGFSAYMEGNWTKAYEAFNKGEQILREQCTNVTWELDTKHYFYMRTLLFLGRLTELLEQRSSLLKEAQERGDLFVTTNLRIWSHMIFLASDNPKEAKKDVIDAMAGWASKSFDLQHYWSLYTRSEIDFYCNDFESAWLRIEETWPKLNNSFFLLTQIIAIESLHLRARACLGLASKLDKDHEGNINRLLSIAERDAKRIEREKMYWGNALANLVKAGIAIVKDQVKTAAKYLIEAEVDFENTKMELYLMATRYRRGQLISGEQGRQIMQISVDWLLNQKIKEPEKIFNMLAPGKWPKQN
ncbi:MAG: protein kinase [Acidobacteria bacterium]|nr:protein kinase [Acidobacteriota bacterium]